MKPEPENKSRPNAQERGYTSKWQRESKAFLAANPRCAMCGGQASLVDHVKPHRRNWKLFWNRRNWQPLCAPCHNGPKQSAEKLGYSPEIGSDGLPIDNRHPFFR